MCMCVLYNYCAFDVSPNKEAYHTFYSVLHFFFWETVFVFINEHQEPSGEDEKLRM